MTTIKGFIDGMLDGTIPPEETKHYLGIVSQETGRLARLVQNMLDITKLEAGEVPIHAQTYDLWKTVTDVVLSDEQRIEDGKIDIQGLGGDPQDDLRGPGFCASGRIILYTPSSSLPAGGTISFAAGAPRQYGGGAHREHGRRHCPEALPFVFERFYKEDRSRGMNTRGSGLGLHICKIFGQPFPAARSTPRARKATGAGSCLHCRQGNKQPHIRRCTKAASAFCA